MHPSAPVDPLGGRTVQFGKITAKYLNSLATLKSDAHMVLSNSSQSSLQSLTGLIGLRELEQ